jgi:hypothetical protein
MHGACEQKPTFPRGRRQLAGQQHDGMRATKQGSAMQCTYLGEVPRDGRADELGQGLLLDVGAAGVVRLRLFGGIGVTSG